MATICGFQDNIKGFYYLATGKKDSAEFYFRKELCHGSDFNNQHAAAKGLAELYQSINQSDSVAKYYRYAYAMNDSVYAKRTTEDVERLQAIYDYSRNQEMAKKMSEEAQQNKEGLQYVLMFSLILFLVGVNLVYRIIRKQKESLDLYMQSLEELKQLRTEKEALSRHQEEFCQMILEKDKRINYLENRVKKYGKQAYFTTANAERCLKESPTYREYEKKAIQGLPLTDEDWRKISNLIQEYLPSFDDFLATNQHRLKLAESRILMLLRLHFKAVDITGMIGLSKSQISQSCTEIMKKIYSAKGSSKELSSRIEQIF